MAITLQQISQLVNEARAEGLDTDGLRAFEEMLLDRAAEMDGATRLEMAAQTLPDEQFAPINTFIDESAAITRGVIKRGAADLAGMSNNEWEGLKNEV